MTTDTQPAEEVGEVDLGAMTKRLAFLRKREAALTNELARTRQGQDELDVALERARTSLAEGDIGTGEVARLVQSVETQRLLVSQLEAAHVAVETEHGELSVAVEAEEREQEGARQEKAVRPLREDAERIVARFVETVLGLPDILRQHKELADRVEREYPLVKPIAPIRLHDASAPVRPSRDGGLRQHGGPVLPRLPLLV